MQIRTTLHINIEIPEDVDIQQDYKRALCEQMTKDLIYIVETHINSKARMNVKGKSIFIEKDGEVDEGN